MKAAAKRKVWDGMAEKTDVGDSPGANPSRRDFLRMGFQTAAAATVAGFAFLTPADGGEGMVWQLDPEICVQCEKCAENCVLTPSAVKCFHAFDMCGYCKLCFGFFPPEAVRLDEAAENQICPTGAIQRRFVEDPYYEYGIDPDLCIGCSKCVKGCNSFGNGSLFLQVRHDLCLNCNDCSIARSCPSGAFSRVPAESPYILKGGASGFDGSNPPVRREG
jgi:electron transport complex protein RnfB